MLSTTPLAWGDGYFLGLISLLAFSSWRISIPEEEHSARLSMVDLAFLAMVAAAVISYRLYSVSSVGLWADELSQMALSNQHNAATACAGQSQPPLDCALTVLGQNIFGSTEIGVRFHSALSSSLAAIFLALNLLLIGRSYMLAAAGAILFSWPDIIFMLGYEVRPVSLGLLFAIFSAAWFTNVLRKGKPSSGDFLAFGISVALFLLSIGLQAPASVAFLVGVCLVAYACTRRQEILWLSIAGIFGILLFLPQQFFVIQTTVPVIRPLSVGLASDFVRAIFSHSLYFFHSTFSAEFQHVAWFLLLFPFPAIVFGFVRDRKNRSWQNMCIVYAVCLAVLFILPAYASVFIALPFKARYILVLWPWLILAAVMAAQYWMEIYPSRRRALGWALAALFLAPITIPNPYSYRRITIYPDIRGIYEWVRQRASTGDELVSLCFSYDHVWCQANVNFQIAGDIYFKEKNGAHEPRMVAAHFLFDAFFNKKPIQRLIVMSYELEPMVKHLQMRDLLGEEISKENMAEREQISAFILVGGTKKIKEEWYALVGRVNEKLKGNSVIVDEFMMQKAYFEGDVEGFKKYRDRMLAGVGPFRIEETKRFYRKYFSEKEFP